MRSALTRLVYRSKSRLAHDDTSAVDALFRTSVQNNGRDGIHGCLALPDGHFVQVIEGEEVKVSRLMERIKADDRHFNVVGLGQWPIVAPLFNGWAMARPDTTPLADQQFKIIDQVGSGVQVTSVLLSLVRDPASLYELI